MSDTPDHRSFEPVDPAEPRAPRAWAWIAAGLIIVMGAYGLYRGFSGVEGSHAPLLGAAGLVVAPASTTPAAPLPPNGQWSTLSGPKVLPPPTPKAAVVAAAPDDADDDSSAPDDDDAAVAEAPPPDQAPPAPKAAPSPPTDSASQSQPGGVAPF